MKNSRILKKTPISILTYFIGFLFFVEISYSQTSGNIENVIIDLEPTQETQCFGSNFTFSTFKIREIENQKDAFGITFSELNTISISAPDGYQIIGSPTVTSDNDVPDINNISAISNYSDYISFTFTTNDASVEDTLVINNFVLTPIPLGPNQNYGNTLEIYINIYNNSDSTASPDTVKMAMPTLGLAYGPTSVPYCEFIDSIPIKYHINSGTCNSLVYDSLVAFG
jgi:hypothetical protein